MINLPFDVSCPHTDMSWGGDIRMRREECACFSGHRYLSYADRKILLDMLPQCIEHAYHEYGIRTFISGAALGFDTMAALAVLDMKQSIPDIRLVLAVPCMNQAALWSASDQMVYDRLLEAADRVHYVSRQNYVKGCMWVRNQYMVNHSRLCIAFLTRYRGGTLQTVRYGIQQEDFQVWLIGNDRQVRKVSRQQEGFREAAACSYMSTFPSAPENVSIVISSPFRRIPVQLESILTRYSKKQR